METLVENGLIKKVKTDKDIMPYDGIRETHHHLYSMESDFIQDYMDKELDEILQNNYQKKNLSGFKVEDIVLQIKEHLIASKN